VRVALAAAALLLGGCGGSSEPSGPRTGEQVFADEDCGSCHTLAKAGATGTVGPALDGAGLSAAAAEDWVRDGGSGMPAYGGRISDADIAAVARYVAGASGR
jgi:mono/diheme cytochrome c family protein